MFPPTPTPLPAVMSVPVTIDYSQFRIWAFTDEAIMIWNRANDIHGGTVIQIGVILVILIGYVIYLTRLAQALTAERDI